MNRIAASELIINARGAIYHLDLRPEELAENVITVGDPGRVEKISKYFDTIDHASSHREFIVHTGWVGKKHISVVSTGIGPDNIDIVVNELDALVNIDLETRVERSVKKKLNIIRIGTSGSLQADIDVDSFVAGTHGLGLDNLMHFYPFSNNNEELEILGAFKNQTSRKDGLSEPYIFSAGTFLLAKLIDGCHAGITVTCPGFYGPQGRMLRLGLSMPMLNQQLTDFRFGNHRICNFEMETSAIYGLGSCLGHQCLSLNVIVANRIAKKFSTDPNTAIDKLIRHVLEKL